MERRESSADDERMDEGNTPPEEVLNPPDDAGQANEEVIYAQGDFPTLYEYEEAGPSAGVCEFGFISRMYATGMDDPSSESNDDDPPILFREDEYHQEFPSGATYSSERERNPPPTDSTLLEICKRALPNSEGRMVAYIKKLRRERDRILSSMNEQRAMLQSLYEMLDNPPEPSHTTWFDHYKTYNVDQSVDVNNKKRYFSLMSGNSIYFVHGAGDRVSYASGYTFDGASLSRNPDLPPTSDNSRSRIDFSKGGFTVGRSASVDSLPALIELDRSSIGEINSESGQRTEETFGIISPIEDDSSSQISSYDTDQLEIGSGSNEDSSHNNQLESESGNLSNCDSSGNERLVRSASNQDSSESESNQDSSNSKQLQSSTTNQDSNASAHDYAIPGPSSSNVYFAGADNPSSEEQSVASNFQSNVDTVYSPNPAPSGSNQNRDQEVSNNSSNTDNVDTDRIAVSQYGGAALVPSPQVPIAMHSNQSFYNPTDGNFNAVASTGQMVSYNATNYPDSRISSAVVNTTTGGYVPVPNVIYASGETAAFNANVPGQSFTHSGYHSSGGNYGTNYGYSGGHGSMHSHVAVPINMHPPVAVSRIVNNNVGVQGFASMNVVTQTNVSSGVCLDNTQSFQANNPSRPYPNNPPVYYPLATPGLYNMQSYEQPQGPSPIYGYNQAMNNNTVVLSMPPSAFPNFIPPEIQSIPVNMTCNPATTQVQSFMGINTPRGMYFVPYTAINIIPYVSGGMYNTVNVSNNMPIYNPNSWHSSRFFDARCNIGYMPPGNYAYGVQGNLPQLTDPSQELDQEESIQPTTSEDIDDRGSARTRGFITAIPQTNDPQSDNPNDSAAQACAPEGESVQTSVSKGGKTKKSTHKKTHESSPLRESSTNKSSPEKGKVTEVMKFPECASGEQFPEVITSAEGSQSSIHESGNWQKNVSRSSGGMTPAVSTSEGGSLRNSDVNTSQISTNDRKKSRENYSEDPHFGIWTRSKTRELLSRKESEKSNLSERTMDVDGAAAVASSSAIDVEGGNFTSRTRRRSSRTRKRKQSAPGKNRDMPEGNLPEVLTETPTEHNNAVAASEAGISGAELEAASSGPLGGGASRATPVDTRISEAVVEGDVSGTVEDTTLGITGTALSVSLSSRNRRKTIGAIKNRPTKPQSVNQDSRVASQSSSSGLSNQSEIVKSETSELAAGISLGASTDSDIKDESAAEGASDTPSTSWNFIGMRTKKGVHSTKRKVSEKSYHSISRSSKQADVSAAIAEAMADETKEETDDSSGEPEMSIQMLEVMPSTSSGQTATGAIPKTASSGSKTKVTETDTTSKIFKTLPSENVIEREPSSTSMIRNRLSIPLVDIHRPGTSGSQPGTSDQRQRSSREITLDRIQGVERILTKQRNNYNSILNILRVIDDNIIEACLVEDDQEDP